MNNGTTPAAQRSATSALPRRRVLQVAGLTALAGAAGLAGPGLTMAHADNSRSSTKDAYDAIVIGAGFAGVTAARELRAKGLRPLILEARDRIGGRTWTADFNGTGVEMGGESVDVKQPYVWKEVQRYQIPLGTSLGADRMYFPTATGGFAPIPPADVVPRLKSLFTPLFDGSQDYFPRPFEPLYRRDLVQKVDQLSMRDRLNQLRLSPADELWVSGSLGGLSGGSSKRGAFSMLAQSWALSGYTFEGYLSVNTYHPAAGTSTLIKAMLADAKADLRLNTPVAKVEQTGGQVRVTTRTGQVFTAPVAVLAVPVNVWKNITFAPALPAEYVTVSRAGIGVPNVQKLWLSVKGVPGRFATNPAEGAALGAVRPHSQLADGSTLMFAFAYDPKFNGNDRAQVQSALEKVVPGVEVTAVKAHSWAADPFALGGWACRQPGMLTGPFSSIQKPQGRLSFATSDIANGWSGYIDGAIESGITAAGQAAALLAGRHSAAR
ncbi:MULTISPECIES: flavin monoamine oxidase family protein [unclassified Streptomyces]|uniref:flavin monoamine oxidase family protein n=1 Tax=unclassified Streptomyces TaxID=2593676 RepID=UPI0037F5C76D